MRRIGLVFVLSVAFLGLLTLLTGRRDLDSSVLLQPGETQLYYVIEPGRPLVLEAAADARRVKLVALLELPPGEPDDPDIRYPFGLVASLRPGAEQAEVWRETVWFEAGRSFTEPGPDGSPGWRRAALVERDGLLTDERVVELDLSALGSRHGQLVLEALPGAVDPVLVRPYRRSREEVEFAALARRSVESDRRVELTERVGAASWSELTDEEQVTLASFYWQRMEAEGARDQDYLTRRVVVTDPPLGGSPSATPGIHLLDPGQAVALNLRGPTRVQVSVWTIDRQHSWGARLMVLTVSQWGRIEMVDLGGLGPEARVEMVTVGADEVLTLTLANDGEVPVWAEAVTRDAPDALFAETTGAWDAPRGVYRLGPDVRIQRWSRIDGLGDVVSFELRPAAADRVRIRARSVGAVPATVTVEMLDGAGQVLARSELSCGGPPSPYETIRRAAPGAKPEPTGQPAEAELWYGRGARSVRLQADAAVDVTASVPVSSRWDASEVDPCYALQTQGVELRYEPRPEWRWVTLSPSDHEALALAGRESFLSAQVRLEPVDEGLLGQVGDAARLGWETRPVHRQGLAWVPDGELPRQRLVERWSPTASEVSRDGWPAGARTRLPADRPVRLHLPDSPGETLRLELWVEDPAALGRVAVIRVGGRELARVSLDSPQLELCLGPLPAGEQEVEFNAVGEGVVALVDQPPVPGVRAELYRVRTVYRLSLETPVQITIPVEAGAAAALYVLPYYELDDPASLHLASAQVDLAPQVKRPTWTAYERTTPTQILGWLEPRYGPVGFLADRHASKLVRAAPIPVRLGDDLAGREISVMLRRLDDGDPVWVRLVALGVEAPESVGGTQWAETGGTTLGSLAWADPFEPTDPLPDLVADALGDPRGSFQLAPEATLAPTRDLSWRLIDAARRNAVEALPSLADEAAGLGFELVPWSAAGLRVVVLRAAQDRGQGWMLVRFGGVSSGVVWQAPHAFHDRESGTIAGQLMAESGARVLLINTRHRYVAGSPEKGQPPPASDVAHRDDSAFHAMTLGALDAIPRPVLVQVHGFGRDTVEDPEVDAVISGGLRPEAAAVAAFAAALGERAPERGVAVYPADIDVLGALTNVQGHAVARRPGAVFLHVELGPEWREELSVSAEARSALIGALETVTAADPWEDAK